MKPFVIANWKLHKTIAESVALVQGIHDELYSLKQITTGIAPPFTALYPLKRILQKHHSTIMLGAQNTYHQPYGSYTGEVSPVLLKDVGCQFCIVGHSERRKLFHETDEDVSLKVKALTEMNLTSICCIGESLEEKKRGDTLKVIRMQTQLALHHVSDFSNIVFAYEPLWAIGTGKYPHIDEIKEAHHGLREFFIEHIGKGYHCPIIYGGSVNQSNALSIIQTEFVDGLLIGGASLSREQFVSIIKDIENHQKRCKHYEDSS